MYFPALDNLIRMLAALPGVGRRSAMRIAFHFLRADHEQVEQLSAAMLAIRREIRFCSQCGGLTDRELCNICDDPARSAGMICVVEEPGDIFAIEKTGEFGGTYHVLGGALSPLDGIGPEQLRLPELLNRIKKDADLELFIATNPTLEGDATADYLQDLLKDYAVRITRISHGIPTGTPIEFADRAALARSIRGRRDL